MASPIPVLPAVPSTIVPPGRSRPFRFGVADDLQRCPVLDRLAGIEKLCLAKNGAAGGFRRRPEADERCVADGVENGLDGWHGVS
jgi:hypothetical protein